MRSLRGSSGTYPKSTLLPAVLFRTRGRRVSARALKHDRSERQKQDGFGEAVTRYKRLVRKFPEFAYINRRDRGSRRRIIGSATTRKRR